MALSVACVTCALPWIPDDSDVCKMCRQQNAKSGGGTGITGSAPKSSHPSQGGTNPNAPNYIIKLPGGAGLTEGWAYAVAIGLFMWMGSGRFAPAVVALLVAAIVFQVLAIAGANTGLTSGTIAKKLHI